MSEATASHVAHHFDDADQQYESSRLGMWLFLVTEVLFFGGMFGVYCVYRSSYPEGFAEGSGHLDVTLGVLNTAVLLCSSLTMALAVHAAQVGNRSGIVRYIALTILMGLIFLGVKAVEYGHKFEHHLVPGPNFDAKLGGDVQLFYSLYFAMTAMHAFHMVIGIGVMTVIALMAARGRFSAQYFTPVEMTGLYWHFVDIVWVFLFPLLYLIY